MSIDKIKKETLNKVDLAYDGPERASAVLAYSLGARRAIEVMAEAGVIVDPGDVAKMLDRERAMVVSEMRLLADLRGRYGALVEDEALTIHYVADIISGEETGEGWIPTHLQDRWRGTAGLS